MNSKLFIHFLEGEKELVPKTKAFLRETIETHALKTCVLLGIPYVNITVYANQSFVIPETGEGGFAVSGDWFQLYLDPTQTEDRLREIITVNLPLTVYHELNHVARWRSIGYGSTLPEAIVTEGLAGVFATENWKKADSPWTAYSSRELAGLMKIYQGRDKRRDGAYVHADWFYGAGELPRWIGYKLGFHIIQSFRKNNPAVGWEALTNMRAEKIIKLSGSVA